MAVISYMYFSVWRATVTSLVSVCDVRLRAHNGVVESINYPAPYPHQQNCSYVIEGQRGNTISLQFTHLDVEGSTDCQYDSIEVRLSIII